MRKLLRDVPAGCGANKLGSGSVTLRESKVAKPDERSVISGPPREPCITSAHQPRGVRAPAVLCAWDGIAVEVIGAHQQRGVRALGSIGTREVHFDRSGVGCLSDAQLFAGEHQQVDERGDARGMQRGHFDLHGERNAARKDGWNDL